MTVIYGILGFAFYIGLKGKGHTLYVTAGDSVVPQQVISTYVGFFFF